MNSRANIKVIYIRDCEIIVADPGGALDFEAVVQRFMSKKSAYKIVEVIYKDGQSIASKPLTVSKTVLKSL
ncbi:hypothetical protein NRS6085_10700 [Bacillus subtilis]|nr:DNA ligase-1 [Bacillus subtilis J24]TWG76596.1 DNA ligase-1 [Bacillus subtilis J26]CAF1785831.1 hypothetical protein NRS6085_01110 [Bacillus subtilis]CAI6270947.1 hypothetical protein NRS6085_10700 [Bacillus subtilis]